MVRRFQFRLETVRKIRERERDAQRLIVAESASATESVRQRVVGLTNEFADNAERSRGVRPVGRLDLHLVRMHLIHRVWLHGAIGAARVEFGERESKLHAERSKLAEASKRLKVIEKLRERQWARHAVEINRAEQMAGDEAAQQLFFRRRSGDTGTS